MVGVTLLFWKCDSHGSYGHGKPGQVMESFLMVISRSGKVFGKKGFPKVLEKS